MNLEIDPPPPRLTGIIDSIIAYREYRAPSPFEALLPDGSSQLVVPLDDGPRAVLAEDGWRSLDAPWITGVQSEPLWYLGERDAATVCIRFSPSGFFAAFGVPLRELEDRVVPAEDVLGVRVHDLRAQLAAAPDRAAREAVIDSFMARTPAGPDGNAPVARFVIDELRRGRLTVRQIVERSGYSWKHLIDLFAAHVGVSPARYKRLYRFNRILRAVHHERTESVATAASDGYFDQSHLIREFRAFAGMTPGRYRAVKGAFPHVLEMHAPPVGR